MIINLRLYLKIESIVLIAAMGIRQNTIKATKTWLSGLAAIQISGIILGIIHGFLTSKLEGFIDTMWYCNDRNPSIDCCGAL